MTARREECCDSNTLGPAAPFPWQSRWSLAFGARAVARLRRAGSLFLRFAAPAGLPVQTPRNTRVCSEPRRDAAEWLRLLNAPLPLPLFGSPALSPEGTRRWQAGLDSAHRTPGC